MRNRRFLLVFLLLIFLCADLFGRGKKDDTLKKPQNNDWILCITSIDASALPPDKSHITNIISREMVERLNVISYRTRISPEYAFYEEFAWVRDRSAAARAIAAKMDERTAVFYRGDPAWKYKQNIARIDADLEKLRANFEAIDNNPPLINIEPAFNLTKGNLGLSFPAPPETGAERRFCASQNADAFLTGSIIDFYGRFLLSVRLYTVFTGTFVWEESAIFSQDNIDYAISEILQKLVVELSGNTPAIVEITAEPKEALVLINKSFAGRGGTDILELPPSTIIVTASAPDHESVTFETNLSADELTKIDINLNPVDYANVRITGEPGGIVYQGALFVGIAPLTLRLPVNNLEYIEMQSSNSHVGTIVLETPETSNISTSFPVKLRQPLPAGRVARDRRHYYWVWGATWVTGIAYWIADYSYKEAASTFGSYPSGSNLVNNLYYFRLGSLIGLGVTGAYGLYRFIRYLVTANRGSTSVVAPSEKIDLGGN